MLFNNIRKIFRKNLGVDLGTANTLIHVEDEGIVFNEPTVIAMSGSGRVLDIGARACPYLGRTPDGIMAVRPMAHGVISDFHAVSEFIRAILYRVKDRRGIFAPAVVVCVPSNITRTEQRTVLEAVLEAGVHRVWLMEEIMAAAAGAGVAVGSGAPSMVVDIGGGTTEAAVISDMAYLASETLRAAGDDFNDLLERYMRRKRSLVVSNSAAERLKWDAGAVPGYDGETLEVDVKGKDAITGMPAICRVTSLELGDIFRKVLIDIVEMVKDVMRQVDIEVMQHIAAQGVTLTGGGALLRGMDGYLSRHCGIRFHLTSDPLKTVITGAGMAVEEPERYRAVFIN